MSLSMTRRNVRRRAASKARRDAELKAERRRGWDLYEAAFLNRPAVTAGHLAHVAGALTTARDSLHDALSAGTLTEGIVLLDLIGRAAALRHDVIGLASAHAGDAKGGAE